MGKIGGMGGVDGRAARATAKNRAVEPPFRVKIRWATRADAAALRAIYAYYVENTTVSFEYEAPSVAEMERRIADVEGVYPFLVCVVEDENGEIGENAGALPVDDRIASARIGKTGEIGENDKNCKDGKNGKTDKTGVGGERIVGYALAHRAFERAAYSWTAETAVYVDRNWRRRGVGEALYSRLIEILEAQGVRTLYAVVVAENKASVEFHRRAGYREFATFKDSGWKFGRWLDVVWLERTLGVWRDDEEKKTEKSGGNKASGEAEETAKTSERGRASKLAPTPFRPLAELAEDRLAAIGDAELRFR